MTSLLLRWFVKDFANTEHPKVRASYGKLSGSVGIFCNVLLCVSKFIIGTISGAVSIAADAVNNLADAASSIMTLVGFRLAEKPADEEHPFGHARLEYLSGLAVAALILVIGVLLLISSVEKLCSEHPQAALFSWTMILVLGLSIAVKLWMSVFNRKLGRRIQSPSLMATAADSTGDVLSTSSVLLACVAGAVIERVWDVDVGGYIDGAMGVIVALFILYSGFGIAKDTISPLLGESADPELVRLIRTEIGKREKVLGIHDLIVHDYGPGQRFASVHVEMDQRIPVMEAHDLIDNIEMDFRTHHHIELVIHYDPVVTDDEELNFMRKVLQSALAGIDTRLRFHDLRMVKGESHTNLIFDLVIPMEDRGREKALQQQIEQAIQQTDMRYYVAITFDLAALSPMDESDNL